MLSIDLRTTCVDHRLRGTRRTPRPYTVAGYRLRARGGAHARVTRRLRLAQSHPVPMKKFGHFPRRISSQAPPTVFGHADSLQSRPSCRPCEPVALARLDAAIHSGHALAPASRQARSGLPRSPAQSRALLLPTGSGRSFRRSWPWSPVCLRPPAVVALSTSARRISTPPIGLPQLTLNI